MVNQFAEFPLGFGVRYERKEKHKKTGKTQKHFKRFPFHQKPSNSKHGLFDKFLILSFLFCQSSMKNSQQICCQVSDALLHVEQSTNTIIRAEYYLRQYLPEVNLLTVGQLLVQE